MPNEGAGKPAIKGTNQGHYALPINSRATHSRFKSACVQNRFTAEEEEKEAIEEERELLPLLQSFQFPS